MSDFPPLVPPWTRTALVHDTTDLFGAETMAALDARYPGGGGGGGGGEVRHDSDATHSWMGTAPAGTLESAPGWTVTRITLTSPPTTGTGTGAWVDRETLTYT